MIGRSVQMFPILLYEIPGMMNASQARAIYPMADAKQNLAGIFGPITAQFGHFRGPPLSFSHGLSLLQFLLNPGIRLARRNSAGEFGDDFQSRLRKAIAKGQFGFFRLVCPCNGAATPSLSGFQNRTRPDGKQIADAAPHND